MRYRVSWLDRSGDKQWTVVEGTEEAAHAWGRRLVDDPHVFLRVEQVPDEAALGSGPTAATIRPSTWRYEWVEHLPHADWVEIRVSGTDSSHHTLAYLAAALDRRHPRITETVRRVE